MNKTLISAIVALLLITLIPPSFADTATQAYIVSTTIPSASGVTVDASKEYFPGESVPVSSSTLSIDLSYNGRYYGSLFYYRLKIKPQGAGALTTVVTYTEGQRPDGAVKGFGDVCVGSFYKGDYATGGPGATLPVGGKLAGMNITITPDMISGGFLIMHFGLQDYAFLLSDAPGVYDGTLTLTSTLS